MKRNMKPGETQLRKAVCGGNNHHQQSISNVNIMNSGRRIYGYNSRIMLANCCTSLLTHGMAW